MHALPFLDGGYRPDGCTGCGPKEKLFKQQLFREEAPTEMLFAIVPFRSLDAGPEFYNNLYSPHNCVGGTEAGCVPGSAEASYLFKDPSKIAVPNFAPRPSSWYKDSHAEFL